MVKNYKNAVIYSEITAFGTPGETRTHYLALRRRTLYPGELRGLILKIRTNDFSILPDKKICVNLYSQNPNIEYVILYYDNNTTKINIKIA